MSISQNKMQKSLEKLKERIQGLRTNRANPELLNSLKVDYYNSIMPLQQLASVTTPDSKLFVLNVFDKGAISAIEKSIQTSNLGLNPQIEGTSIKIRLPELTQERREELIKVLSTYCEETKVMIRNIRREAMDSLKKEKQNDDISEDDLNKEQQTIQKLTDRFITEIEKIKSDKEKDLLEI